MNAEVRRTFVAIIGSMLLTFNATASAKDAYERCIERVEERHDRCLSSNDSNCGTERSDGYEVCRENFFYE